MPQGRHLHGLLPRGAQVLEELFPGILDELVLDGAHYMDGRDLSRLHYNVGGHLMVRTGSATSFTAYLATRPFLEEHVRARLRNIPNVTLLDEHDIVELTSTPDHHRVTGARVVNRRTREDATLSADLVVDATGRAARTPTWLNRLGYDRPREDHVVVQLTYVSQLLRMAPDALHELGFVVGIVPGRPHGLGILHCENDTWMFTVFGIAGHEPPPDLAAMCEFVEDYAPAHMLAAVRAAEPIGEPDAAPSAVQSVAPLRQDATISGGPAGHRRRDLQLQPDLRPGHDGGRTGGVGAARLLILRHKGFGAAILPRRGGADPPGVGAVGQPRPLPTRNRRHTTAAHTAA